jgi:hypothetical protein
MRRSTVGLVLALAAAGCRDSPGPVVPTTTPTTSTPTTSTPVPTSTTMPPVPGDVAMVVTGLVLAADQPFRVLVEAPAGDGVLVTLRGLPAPNRSVRVCPPSGGACGTPAEGETVPVPEAGVQVVAVGSGRVPVGDVPVGEVEVRWRPAGAEARAELRLPGLRPGDALAFALAPPPAGTVRAQATWVPPQGTSARLTLEAGPRTVATAEGGPPLDVSTRVSPPAETVLRLANTGQVDLPAAVLSLRW